MQQPICKGPNYSPFPSPLPPSPPHTRTPLPPTTTKHRCGPFDYKVRNMPDDNQPRNILEEIVWYKAKEIESWRDRVPLAMLQVRRLGVWGGGWCVCVCVCV